MLLLPKTDAVLFKTVVCANWLLEPFGAIYEIYIPLFYLSIIYICSIMITHACLHRDRDVPSQHLSSD
jgi:hypothetical protein